MKKRNYAAAILAAVMVFQTPIMAFADDESSVPETVTYGDVTITNEGWHPDPDNDEWISYSVDSWEDGGMTTAGNVTSTVASDTQDSEGNSGFPAVAAGNGGTVQINGDVSSEYILAVLSVEGGTVNVTGNVTSGVEDGSAVIAADGGTVDIGGDVANVGNGTGQDGDNRYGTSNGIEISGQSTVKVGGDVTTESGVGISVNAYERSDKGNVWVGGCVSSAQDGAINTNAASDITIGENVTGNTGINISLNGSGGTIEVLGTVKSTEDFASVICIVDTDITDKDELADALPTIVVGSLEGASGTPDDFLWISSENDVDNEDKKDELYDAVFGKILYYIAKDKFANASLSVEGANTYKNGYTANEENTITVTIAAADGYEVSSVSGTDVVKNADGTYAVVVQRGKGIDINAVISAVMRAPGSTNQSPVIVTRANAAAQEQSVVIAIPTYTIAQKQFQAAIAAQLKTLPEGSTLTIDMKDSAMKDCISFNEKTFEILSQRKDVDIRIIYTWKGKEYAVVIPAGYDILSLLDSNGYCGCLYLNHIFGSTELTK